MIFATKTQIVLLLAGAAVVATAWSIRHHGSRSVPPTPGGFATPSRESIAPVGPDANLSEPAPIESEQVDAILRSDQPDAEKATDLLALIPELPPAIQAEALIHALNLLGDDRFAQTAGWLAPEAPRQLARLVLAESATRPDRVKLPLWLDILDTPGHPLHTEARLFLLPYVGLERIDNPAVRREAVSHRLRQGDE